MAQSFRAMLKVYQAPESPVSSPGLYEMMTISFARPKPVDKTIPTIAYRWETLHWQGRAITAVGTTKLPTPIILPAWLQPLGDQALTADTTTFDHHFDRPGVKGEKGTYQVDLWFPVSQTRRMWQWLNGFPTASFLPHDRTPLGQEPRVRFAYHDPNLLSPYNPQHEWGDGFLIYLSSNSHLEFQTNYMDVPPKKDGIGMSFLPGLGAALLGPSSPVRHEKGIINFDLRFITER